jgi:hypothetical protein
VDASAKPAGAEENFAVAAYRGGLTMLPFFGRNAFRRQADSPLPKGVSNLRKRFAVVPSLQAAFHARAVEIIDSAESPHVKVHGRLDGHGRNCRQMMADG